ncbi:uncharacterized protein EAE98_009151 [Botrytis deweyae]|uniref:Uncharacterized protein n=1 Tax=Botrytis deweyae TaxID=2478750 RepID=A0ABQ7ICB0_9HELO|nr:uncharacterized protein EAE98_009151 [Botrytis deweyae]KAF7919917.1 hypothetical protein EAE98_009151 [Botrytis deweyae]
MVLFGVWPAHPQKPSPSPTVITLLITSQSVGSRDSVSYDLITQANNHFQPARFLQVPHHLTLQNYNDVFYPGLEQWPKFNHKLNIP